MARSAFPSRCAFGLFPCRGQSRRGRGQPVRARIRPPRACPAPGAAVLSGVSRRHEHRRARRRRVHFSSVMGIHVAVVVGAGHGASSRQRQRPRGIRLFDHGELRHARAAAYLRPAGGARWRLCLCRHPRRASLAGARGLHSDPCADRRRLQSRPRAAARLVAARASGGAEPRLGADERGDDQGRRLRLRAHRVRPARHARLVVEHGRARARRASPR